MGEILVIGAGITGGYTAARLFDNGAEISLLARGEKADRLEKVGLQLRDGLTGAVYLHDGDLEAVASDRKLLKMTMRAVVQGLDIVRQSGYPVLPKGLKTFRFMPSAVGAMKIARTLRSRFGEIALAGHASAARNEMRHLAKDLLGLAGQNGGQEFTELLGSI